ncbi:MAG TPA: Asp/Glu racemase [Arenibaculum sp.]|nr:Asp/Glu racemase [Arenibaculum sp.]
MSDVAAVHIPCRLDEGPGRRARIGLVVLATDQVTEHALSGMVPAAEVAFFTSRVTNRNPTNLMNLRLLADGLGQAVALILPGERLDAVAFACTSGAVAIGAATCAARIGDSRPGTPWTAPMAAALAAFGSLSVRRPALLTPYTDEVNEMLVAHLEGEGMEVAAVTSFLLESDADMARVAPACIFEAAIAADRHDADCLFIPCTALRAVETLAPLERRLGKPVFSSHQTLLWDALRKAGASMPIPGFGRLLSGVA